MLMINIMVNNGSYIYICMLIDDICYQSDDEYEGLSMDEWYITTHTWGYKGDISTTWEIIEVLSIRIW